MKNLYLLKIFLCLSLTVLWQTSEDLLWAQEASPSKVNPGRTFDNLNAAYIEENAALQRNIAFAQKADEEGLKKIADSFRSAASFEQGILNKFSEYLKTVDIEPEQEVPPPEVKTTLENLKIAWQQEEYNRDMMYPRFITQAEQVKNLTAIELFQSAKAGADEHVKAFEETIKQLDVAPLQAIPTP